ncbi:hypothetical protein UC8_19690 [Roseimaritima ulvae]|uniref:Uncharacterized protein n=1 Tax=Roseimaritima ulvae TaxID=980254 RepID=A0A5B9QSF2_9BACT|nr:hypothetical protein UC8_19690 [Roseimaritima ulvae]
MAGTDMRFNAFLTTISLPEGEGSQTFISYSIARPSGLAEPNSGEFGYRCFPNSGEFGYGECKNGRGLGLGRCLDGSVNSPQAGSLGYGGAYSSSLRSTYSGNGTLADLCLGVSMDW